MDKVSNYTRLLCLSIDFCIHQTFHELVHRVKSVVYDNSE